MRFVGQTEIAAFLADCPAHAEAVRAWLLEIKHRRWSNSVALTRDFLSADVSSPPAVVFDLSPFGIRIGTLIDFRSGVVLLTDIEDYASPPSQLSGNRPLAH